MIITWDFDGINLKHPFLSSFVRHYPSPFEFEPKLQQQLRQFGVLSERDYLILRVLPMPKTHLRVVVLLGIFAQDDPLLPGGVSYEMQELGRLEYPTMRLYSDPTSRLSQLSLYPITPASVSQSLVEFLLRNGCVRVRVKGGAYYVPDFAREHVEQVLHMLEDAGVKVRRIPVERGSAILYELAQDAVASFRQAMEELTRKVREAKQEKVRQRALDELKQLRRFYEYYLDLFLNLGGELREEVVESEVALEALEAL